MGITRLRTVRSRRARHFGARLLAVASALVLLAGALVMTSTAPARAASTDDWPTSLHDVQRTAASSDTTIGGSTAPALTKLWSFQTGGPVATTPTVTGGVAYFGSWDGDEYAVNATTGALLWKTYLGVLTASPTCIPPQLGISSPATVTGGVVYVGGGDGYWYALNAATGAVEWRVWTSGSDTPGTYDGQAGVTSTPGPLSTLAHAPHGPCPRWPGH